MKNYQASPWQLISPTQSPAPLFSEQQAIIFDDYLRFFSFFFAFLKEQERTVEIQGWGQMGTLWALACLEYNFKATISLVTYFCWSWMWERAPTSHVNVQLCLPLVLRPQLSYSWPRQAPARQWIMFLRYFSLDALSAFQQGDRHKFCTNGISH